jgi:ribose 5-phosphate isomerase B
MIYKISIASDHNGVEYKAKLVEYLKSQGHFVLDLGPFSSEESVDYPDYAKKLCESILEGASELGVLICNTGIGMSMAANRSSYIRAALCVNEDMAERARSHNDANVLVLGSQISTEKESRNILNKFLITSFDGGRHSRRLAKIS